MTDIKVGDRVKVTIEGEVTWVGKKDPRHFEIGEHYFSGASRRNGTPEPTVEKIEPPVEVFGPGDVVRYVGDLLNPATVALGSRGFINLETGTFHEYGSPNPGSTDNNGRYVSLQQITSRDYERVTLG